MSMRLIQAVIFCSTILAGWYLIFEAIIGSDYYGYERRFKRGLVMFAALAIASAILVILTPAPGTPAKREPAVGARQKAGESCVRSGHVEDGNADQIGADKAERDAATPKTWCADGGPRLRIRQAIKMTGQSPELVSCVSMPPAGGARHSATLI